MHVSTTKYSMISLGIDIGSSFIKMAVIDSATMHCLDRIQLPDSEMEIQSPHPGWAEQDPNLWWKLILQGFSSLKKRIPSVYKEIRCIGITYQMHGLVITDRFQKPIRNAIIWCDGRAVHTGEKARELLGNEYCSQNLLNAPGNFTASKLAWIKENEPENYKKIQFAMLPGDYISTQLTGEVNTTITGLSEGIFWDFSSHTVSKELLEVLKIDKQLIPPYNPSFAIHGTLSPKMAEILDLSNKTSVSYKAGDQPNNAFSLNVMSPGSYAATAGTSGVMYGITNQSFYDEDQKTNTFAHVNYTAHNPLKGVLLCINGTGSSYAWYKKILKSGSYEEMNELAIKSTKGSGGIFTYPFGNGAERILRNQNPGLWMEGVRFNDHNNAHLIRSLHEGIAFSFLLGVESLEKSQPSGGVIKAGNTNMFQSKEFCRIISQVMGKKLELYSTDGAEGAARGALLGMRAITENELSIPLQSEFIPDSNETEEYRNIYKDWKNRLYKHLQL